jgi:proteasome lid subunit RPN8/RPN11
LKPTTPTNLKIFINRNALESALLAARNTYPNEFIGLFDGHREGDTVCLHNLVIAPLSIYGPTSSSFSSWFVPTGMNIAATFHSHPSPNARPSRQDLSLFDKQGGVHFISSPPYVTQSTNVFDPTGIQLSYKVRARACSKEL